MKLGTIIVILFVIALIAAGAFIYFGATASPAEPQAYAEEVSLQERSANSAVFAALADGGIDSAMADVSAEQVYVAYDLPEGTDAEIMQRYVMGVAASAAGDSKMLAILQYQNEQPKLYWTVSTADFDAFVNGELTQEQLDAKIQKQNV